MILTKTITASPGIPYGWIAEWHLTFDLATGAITGDATGSAGQKLQVSDSSGDAISSSSALNKPRPMPGSRAPACQRRVEGDMARRSPGGSPRRPPGRRCAGWETECPSEMG